MRDIKKSRFGEAQNYWPHRTGRGRTADQRAVSQGRLQRATFLQAASHELRYGRAFDSNEFSDLFVQVVRLAREMGWVTLGGRGFAYLRD